MNSILSSKWTKVVVFSLCLVPLGILVLRAVQGNLTANPIEFITHATGDWTLRFLVLTLAITPLRKTLRLPQLIRFRRMLGLFAFFYACLHFSIYIGLDQVLDFRGVWADVMKRPYITMGFTGFVLMIPLAVTSTRGMIRRLGKRWTAIHRLIYVSATAGVIHYYWLVKADHRLPLTYAAILAVLLAYRIGKWARPKLLAGRVAAAPRNA